MIVISRQIEEDICKKCNYSESKCNCNKINRDRYNKEFKKLKAEWSKELPVG
jgi:hypothetical protein